MYMQIDTMIAQALREEELKRREDVGEDVEQEWEALLAEMTALGDAL